MLYEDAGFTSKQISNVLGRSYYTVQDWVRKTNRGEDIRNVQEGRGRKPTYSPEAKRKVVRAVSTHPQKYSTRNLASKFGMSKTTVWEILKKSFSYGGNYYVPTLTDEEKKNRVGYCKEMLHNDGILFKTFFSDEMGINLSDAHRSKTWAKSHDVMEIEIPRNEIRVSCWGAISFRGATPLSIYKKSMKMERYKKCLEESCPIIDDLYPEGWYLVHDNSTTHSASEQWMKDQGFGQVVFPTYSPDLTPIENLWSTLKESVAKDAPTTEERLIASLRRNWEILTLPRNLQPYFLTLFTRYQECIEKGGSRLNV